MSQLIGRQVQEDVQIQKKLQELVDLLMAHSAQVVGIKPPDPEFKTSNDHIVNETGKFRGRPLFYPYVGTGIGRGPYVELHDGSIKMDLINGIGIHLMGHTHPKVIAATLRGALSDIVVQGNLQPNEEYGKLTRKLVDIAGKKSRLRHAWLATCGTMANENALKACRQKVTPARKIIAMQAAFAGRSTMMAEVTDNPSFKVGLPDYNEVLRIPFYDKNDPRSTEKTLALFRQHVDQNKKNICAFVFEPMQGEGGYNVAPREYFIPMLEVCRQEKIPIWLDEVQTFSRTGEFFAFETLGLGEYVDVCTIAKTAQNGATLYTEELNPQPGLIAGTFSGTTAGLNAGLEIIRILEEENYLGPQGKIAHIHKKFIGKLNELNQTTCKGLLTDAGGLGLMCAVTPLDGSKEKVNDLLKVLFKNGLIAFNCGRGPFRLRFLIPMIMSDADIEVAGKIIEKSVLELA